MARRTAWLLLIALWIVTKTTGADTFFEAHRKGWHWYDDPVNAKPLDSSPQATPPEVQLEAIKMAIKRSLAKAIIEPTPQHVKDYITLQNTMSTQSSRFAHTWQQVLLENPKLNYALKHPTNSEGKHLYLAQKQKEEETAIQKLAKESGLFFFYKSTCPYCQRFAPILKAFATSHGLSVIPITLDGIALPEFPDSVIDNGQAMKFHVEVEPSLFAVNPYTHKAYPIAYGLVSETELRQNILDIATHFAGDS